MKVNSEKKLENTYQNPQTIHHKGSR